MIIQLESKRRRDYINLTTNTTNTNHTNTINTTKTETNNKNINMNRENRFFL